MDDKSETEEASDSSSSSSSDEQEQSSEVPPVIEQEQSSEVPPVTPPVIWRNDLPMFLEFPKRWEAIEMTIAQRRIMHRVMMAMVEAEEHGLRCSGDVWKVILRDMAAEIAEMRCSPNALRFPAEETWSSFRDSAYAAQPSHCLSCSSGIALLLLRLACRSAIALSFMQFRHCIGSDSHSTNRQQRGGARSGKNSLRL